MRERKKGGKMRERKKGRKMRERKKEKKKDGTIEGNH